MDSSIKKAARIAGLMYLIVIAGGIFAEMMVRAKLVVPHDPAATARNIIANISLYRWGFAVEVFYCAINVPLIIIIYKLFKVVNRQLALLGAIFSIIGTAIEAVCLLAHFAPLVLLGNGQELSSFSAAQLQDMAYTSLRFFEYGFCICLVFFGFYCITTGFLIFRSGFMPKLIGVLLGFQGCCYLLNSFANFLAPDIAAKIFPLLAASGLGEISFCLWLLIKGVNEKKYYQRADENPVHATTSVRKIC